MTFYAVNNINAIWNEDITVPTSTQKYPMGLRLNVIQEDDTETEKQFIYIRAHELLAQYRPCGTDHTGTSYATADPATGATLICVPQVQVTSGYYCFALVRGEGRVNIGAETYAVGDHLEVINAAIISNVDGTTGSTVRTARSIGASLGAGTTATNIPVYLFGERVDTAAT